MVPKVKRGDKFAIRADHWNTLADVANAHAARQLGGGPPELPGGAGQVLLRNDTEANRGMGDVLGVENLWRIPTDAASWAQVRGEPFTLLGVEPTEDHYGRFAVLLEPIAAGRIGRACISGPCWAKVTQTALNGEFVATYADIFPGEVTLRARQYGAARILRQCDYNGWALLEMAHAFGCDGFWAKISGLYASAIVEDAGIPVAIQVDEVDPLTGSTFYPSRTRNGSNEYQSTIAYWRKPASTRILPPSLDMTFRVRRGWTAAGDPCWLYDDAPAFAPAVVKTYESYSGGASGGTATLTFAFLAGWGDSEYTMTPQVARCLNRGDTGERLYPSAVELDPILIARVPPSGGGTHWYHEVTPRIPLDYLDRQGYRSWPIYTDGGAGSRGTAWNRDDIV